MSNDDEKSKASDCTDPLRLELSDAVSFAMALLSPPQPNVLGELQHKLTEWAIFSPSDVNAFAEVWYRKKRDHSAVDHRLMNAVLDQVVERFKNRSETERDEFRGQLTACPNSVRPSRRVRSRSTCLQVRKPLSRSEKSWRLTLSNGVPFDGQRTASPHDAQNHQNGKFTISHDAFLPR